MESSSILNVPGVSLNIEFSIRSFVASENSACAKIFSERLNCPEKKDWNLSSGSNEDFLEEAKSVFKPANPLKKTSAKEDVHKSDRTAAEIKNFIFFKQHILQPPSLLFLPIYYKYTDLIKYFKIF